ncbi:MAG TPA: FAD-binding oxidoreductase [Syntrophorhabdaceae bacterium]|nr:FAD-binding oxidoreductase [Syntrophorhabdaceae bacterium]
MKSIYEALVGIVDGEHVSDRPEELYIYSFDLGTAQPQRPDYVVAPRTTQQVQDIVRLANREKIPVVPLGGGLSLAGLAVPLKGGILVDLKRMDSIIEVNEKGRYAVLECGVSQAQLTSYLARNHPGLTHSEPGAPPTATITGNVMIHGQGDLSQPYGFNSDLVNGLEVVLPTGEVCRFGSCAIGASWFTNHPLPDVGLFFGWCGTTGIVTRLSIRLYPAKPIRGVGQFVVENEELVPEIMEKITRTQMAEDIIAYSRAIPPFGMGLQHFTVNIAADSEKELEFKQELIWDDALGEYIRRGDGGYLGFTRGLERPQISKTSDYKKGGGFEYVGGIMPIETYPRCYRSGREISERHGIPYTVTGRCIGVGHSMMFAWTYAFNRADPETIRQAREALHETDDLVLELGGVIWKPGTYGQRLIMERLDPGTRTLMKRIKEVLDPGGIMNPGNWEGI